MSTELTLVPDPSPEPYVDYDPNAEGLQACEVTDRRSRSLDGEPGMPSGITRISPPCPWPPHSFRSRDVERIASLVGVSMIPASRIACHSGSAVSRVGRGMLRPSRTTFIADSTALPASSIASS